MACFHPIAGYQKKDNGQFTFSPKNRGELVPMTIRCGRCIGCRLDYAKEWSVKGYYELQSEYVEKGCFLTLTFATEHLHSDKGLRKSDIRLFMNRLRQYIYRKEEKWRTIKSMNVGEYEIGRAHV